MTTLNLQTGQNEDDSNYHNADLADRNDNTFVSFGQLFTAYEDCGLRFPGVSGLAGATITAALLTFRSQNTDSGDFVGDWYAHDTESPGTFANGTDDIRTRPRTTATCEGDGVADFGSWIINADETFSGDGANTIADIIQELADSYDPSAIALLWIYASGTGSRWCDSYESDFAFSPKLDIDYTGGVSLPEPVLTSITRWYFPESTVAPDSLTPSYDGGWDTSASAVRRKLARFKTGTAMANHDIAETTATNNWDILFRQYISEILPPQSVSGTVAAYIRAVESSGTMNAHGDIIVKAITVDGSSTLATLLAKSSSTTNTNEFDADASLANAESRRWPKASVANTMTTSDITQPWRLCVEIGVRARNTSTTSFTARLIFGDDAGNDLDASETDQGVDNPWIEFSNGIKIGVAPPPFRRPNRQYTRWRAA